MAARWLGRVAVAAILVVGAATLIAFLDRVAWPFELATVFRLQYAAVLLLLSLPAVALGRGRAAAAAAMLAVVNLVAVAPPLADRAEASGRTRTVRLLLANVEAGNDRYADLVQLVRETRPDVVAVTELDASWTSELTRRLPAYRHRISAPQDDAYGIGAFSRLPLVDGRVVRFPSDGGPPTIVVGLRPDGTAPLTLVVTHVHTPFAGSIHERHLAALAAARERLGERLAVCGDFNTVPWASAFRRLADTGLVDLYDGSWPGYSWPTWNRLLRLPIDNCLVGGGGLSVREHWHGPDIGSDHYPLIVELAVPLRT